MSNQPDPMAIVADLMKDIDAATEEVLNMIDEAHRELYRKLINLTDRFCLNHLQPLGVEYLMLCRQLAGMCFAEDSPVPTSRAKPESWAAGIVHAVGMVNFLSDPSFEPVVTTKEIAAAFGISAGTVQGKSSEIRRGLDIIPLDPGLTLPSLMEENPRIWLIEQAETGIVVDIRDRHREEQVKAFEAGLIPYVPADVEDESLADDLPPEIQVAPFDLPDVLGRIGPGS